MAAYMEGPLSKWTNVMKGWQYRWFVLDDNAGLLSYYTSKEKMMRGSRRGCVRLRDAIIGIDDEDDSTFTITVDQKVFHFQARDADERKQWACALEDTILRHSQRQLDATPSPSLDEFDRRLAEADAYLQLLIENVKGVDSKVSAMGGESSEKQDLEGILITAQEMIEAVKKSIVLLQLAKTAVTANASTQHPLHPTRSPSIPPQHNATAYTPPSGAILTSQPATDGIHETQDSAKTPQNKTIITEESDVIRASEQLNGITSENTEMSDDLVAMKKDVLGKSDNNDKQTSSIDTEDISVVVNQAPPTSVLVANDSSQLPAEVNQAIPVPSMPSIPATSYSSSEDEGDEFFDADEDVRSLQGIRAKSTGSEEKSETVQEIAQDEDTNAERELKEIDLSTNNHDDMYMKEDAHNEKEGESVEEHKSVIMHLLSQVKLGMDLTKVVLPTFILERRSLLEMYADFFSHPDYFLQISQKPTAEERMISCVRFYLSTFAAGRNSSVAKKPYNPILGETFQCFWDRPLPDEQPDDNAALVQDGPVPWSKSNQLAFLAEQVSHHPPVSAFYAEHKAHQIQFNGHIWTKSKFLGLSIGVHNIGQGCIRLLDRDEEYIINFPNGYGRSILTIPWVELGGDCTITCEKTGYNAFIKFHTKPFYGGKVHKVTGEVFEPNAKKPFCTLEGEWNSVIYANYSTGRSECFIDAKNKKKFAKTVRKIEHEGPMESRRLWEKVTINLKANNIDEATNAKRALEDKQRQDAKNRLETGSIYKPKHFHEDDCQNWIYSSSLTDRT